VRQRDPEGADDLIDVVPDDAQLREETLISDQVYRGAFLDVRRDQIRLPDDGRLVVERQWRYPLARVMLEFPAGKLEPGEHPLHCAIRELIEETGFRATEWARAGVLHNAIAYSNEAIEVWFARGLTPGERALDAGEFLEVGDASLEELDELARRGELTDAKTLIGMLWLQNWRSGRWTLDWRQAPP
jgi:ADP-ribose pyrophosphatase